ncbi:ribonuclease Z [Paenibacillus koleovorans]|uniref:ribonuclease Z n=1 Tax=Paenibacillus koleovorans TaxID=121608 RepID=UPI000FD895EA|nr:ribonuclease Z [Paenibacillus koleovorans]
MDLYFLGTGAGMPAKERNVTAIALRLYEERGTFWLFDCGEGTQHQVLHSPLKLGKLEFIFITHLHGDHIFGLPGLLSSRSYQGGETPLTLFGPRGIRAFVEQALTLSAAHLAYQLHIVELEDVSAEAGSASADGVGRVVFADEQVEVTVAEVEHRIASYGYRVRERDRPGKLDEAKLRAHGVPAGPLYGRLKRGEDVALPDGRVLRGADFVGAPVPGRTVVVLGDTRRCASAVRLSRGADVLVHEATFAGELEPMAQQFYHTTSLGAAEVAEEAGAKKLILTHLSSRYSNDSGQSLLDEARTRFPNTELAHDHAVFVVELS